MEVEKMMSGMEGSASKDDHGDEVPLPGFRFHPTDEELVGFYLRRKIEKKPLSIELIKQVDIYKYDPWDLPKASNVGDKEWYFFCKRGRKYRNSIRPNRVTQSGFWKATGIDKPVYSAVVVEGEGCKCIGLKKSLVYYRGSAGKGTKTDWMMHEFRLPTDHDDYNGSKHKVVKDIAQEAEVWTICRILKRNASYRKYTPDWRQVASAKRNPADHNHASSSVETKHSHDKYIISFGADHEENRGNDEKKQYVNQVGETNPMVKGQLMSPISQFAPSSSSSQLFSPTGVTEFIEYGDSWDELGPVVEFAFDPFLV